MYHDTSTDENEFLGLNNQPAAQSLPTHTVDIDSLDASRRTNMGRNPGRCYRMEGSFTNRNYAPTCSKQSGHLLGLAFAYIYIYISKRQFQYMPTLSYYEK